MSAPTADLRRHDESMRTLCYYLSVYLRLYEMSGYTFIVYLKWVVRRAAGFRAKIIIVIEIIHCNLLSCSGL